MLNRFSRVTNLVASTSQQARITTSQFSTGIAWIKMAHRSKVVSNAFLTERNTAERIWLVVLNHTVPAMTRWVWDQGAIQNEPTYDGDHSCGLCSAAHFRVCADGGADRLFHHVASFDEHDSGKVIELQKQYRPDIIIGDLDSLSEHVQEFYEGMGVECVDLRTDQDTTDLDKCLEHVHQKLSKHGSQSEDLVVVVGAIGGRLDHTLSNLNSLYTHQGMPIVLVGDGNLVRLLPKGSSKIMVNKEAEDELELKFSGMISTSNQIAGSEISITCSAPCLWMTILAEK